MSSESISVPTDAAAMPARRWLPPAGSGPGLVLFQEIFGVSDYIKRRAADLSALGYVVLAPEIYWRLDDADIDESRPDFLDRAVAVAGRVDWGKAVSDGVAAVAALRADDCVRGSVGVVGFCFGGGLAFNVAADGDPDVLVSYYGSAIPGLLDRAKDVTAPSLHHFGLADAYLSADTVEQIRAAVSREGVRFETYPGAGHAFDNPHPVFHHAEASATAWRNTVDFLALHLPTEAR
ncbi:dienelactone hydrolase family protein [Leekyejoonella antrihumi]|uniref:Dienelactone hydrolase family protein n=1 Tax=Leekyejoonella antrihumi TaxID=1660198 RepID=A0A563E1G5_9MICO|nr:dienelactone hydrolase family protein [Leekyejoonella antrihumi]TWP36209.1 dienelactone hydrolase family protein [Leekyejoonella antrihumi]